MPYRIRTLIPLLILVMLLGCGTPSTPAQPANTAAPEATAVPTAIPATVPPTATSTPKPTLIPMPTKTATPEPTPRPTTPSVLAVISGTGGLVTDNFDLPQCNKAIFAWTAQASNHGTASLIVKLYNVAAGTERSVINEFATDLEGDLVGMELQPLKGGTYYLASENTDLPWEVRIECHDGLAPILSGSMVVTGTGNTVTGFYELPSCNKSVFSWQAGVTPHGTASMIVHLCKDGSTDCESLVNEFQMDLTGPLTGQTVEKLSGGLYYLYVYNLAAGDWSVTWECKD